MENGERKMVMSYDTFRAFGWNDMRATWLLYADKESPSYNPLAWQSRRRDIQRAIEELGTKGNLHYFYGVWCFLDEMERRPFSMPYSPAQYYIHTEPLNPESFRKELNCQQCYHRGRGKVPVAVYNDTILLQDTTACSHACCVEWLDAKVASVESLFMYFHCYPCRPDNPFTLKDDVMARLTSLPPMAYDPGTEAYATQKAIEQAEFRKPKPFQLKKKATTAPEVSTGNPPGKSGRTSAITTRKKPGDA